MISVRHIAWEPCYRVIPTKFAEERILGKLVEHPADLDVLSDLEQMTNERLRQERGEVALVAPRDIVSGAGSEYIMAPFTYPNPEGSRFSDGTYGVYYAGRQRDTAVEETKYHRELFMRRTNEGPMQLEMRIITANLDGELHDIRGAQKKLPQVYRRTDYSGSQAFAKDLLKSSSYGIVYDSVRHKGGQCAAVFRPPVLSRCRTAQQMRFDWDGKSITKVYELKET